MPVVLTIALDPARVTPVVAVRDTAPAPLAVIPLLTVTEPADAINVTLPEVLVVTPLLTVKLPVAAVKLKFMAFKPTLTSVEVKLFVMAYVVSPSPLAKLIACVVFTLAVTVKLLKTPLPDCNK